MKSIEIAHVRTFSWQRGHDCFPLFHSCKEQHGELCCCTTCCDFEAGALLCSYSHFVFSLVSVLICPMFFFLILSFIQYAYTIYKYILHIFLYLCLLLSWEWCGYVISVTVIIDANLVRRRKNRVFTFKIYFQSQIL